MDGLHLTTVDNILYFLSQYELSTCVTVPAYLVSYIDFPFMQTFRHTNDINWPLHNICWNVPWSIFEINFSCVVWLCTCVTNVHRYPLLKIFPAGCAIYFCLSHVCLILKCTALYCKMLVNPGLLFWAFLKPLF